MACGGCKGSGNRHSNVGTNADLKKYAYLTPRQLKYLAGQDNNQQEKDKEKK